MVDVLNSVRRLHKEYRLLVWCLVANYLSFSLSVLWLLFPDLLLPEPPSVDLDMQVKPARSYVNDV